MIAGAPLGQRTASFDAPAFQWDALRGAGPLVVRLFGRLSTRELEQITRAVFERGRSPRDLVCLDFEQVTHVDYRALPEFTRALQRQEHRGARACLLGLSGYVRDLFDVAGQGPALRRLEWMPVEENMMPRRAPLGFTRGSSVRLAEPGGVRR